MAKNSAPIEIDPALPQRGLGVSIPKTDLRKEYAASGLRDQLGDQQVLNLFDDRILRELGFDAYEAAANDPVVESAIEDLVMSATSDEPMFRPAFPKGHERFDEAVQASDFCRSLWENISNDPQDTLEQLARGAGYNGHGVAEQTFEAATAKDLGTYRIKFFKALPRDVTAFVVDRFMNVLGLLASRTGRNVAIGGTLLSGADVVAREKFTILTLRAKGNDPRGRSLVASAMTARNIKRQVITDWVAFLHRKSELVPVGIAGEGAPKEQPIDNDGNVITDASPITAAEAIAQKLALLDVHKSIGLASGADVKTLDLQGDSNLYLNALEWLDLQMTRGIMLQVLATSEAKHGTRAQASVHENVKDLLVFWLKQRIARVIKRDLMYLAMRLNFGDETARELTPDVTLGDYDRKDWAATATAWAALVGTKDMDEHQLETGWSEIGLERGPEGTPKPGVVVPPVPGALPPPVPFPVAVPDQQQAATAGAA